MSTYDTLVTILTDRFKVPASDIKPDITFDELGMDSLFLAEFLVVIEEDLGVQIEDEDVEPTSSLARVGELVDEQLARAGKPS
ncbi:acyl carrier protein [Streptomyces sp. 6N223]|uniref:acyl carrier protein n=1 Tax=Streptomyces sp. 6N223 TaxID=3457412 RepID=UPI003FD55906